MSLPIGLQLYTIRDLMQDNFEHMIEQVAGMGYDVIEPAGLFGRSPQQVRKLCGEVGLGVIGLHVALEDVEGKLSAVADSAQMLGAAYVVVVMVPQAWRDAEGYRRAAQIMGSAAQTLSEAGLTLCYHNHSFEWDPLKESNGVRGIDVLFSDGAGAAVQSELDVYWVKHAGDDPLAWMERLAGRLPLLHVKDMADKPDRPFAEVGTGVINMAAVVAKAESCGVRCLVVEQDSHWINDAPLESVRLSYQNLKQIVEGIGQPELADLNDRTRRRPI